MKLLLTAAVAVLISTAAQAEIMCTDQGGCWETGMQIRLVHNRTETSVPSRDGKGRTRLIAVANDTPHQTFRSPQRRR